MEHLVICPECGYQAGPMAEEYKGVPLYQCINLHRFGFIKPEEVSDSKEK